MIFPASALVHPKLLDEAPFQTEPALLERARTREVRRVHPGIHPVQAEAFETVPNCQCDRLCSAAAVPVIAIADEVAHVGVGVHCVDRTYLYVADVRASYGFYDRQQMAIRAHPHRRDEFTN